MNRYVQGYVLADRDRKLLHKGSDEPFGYVAQMAESVTKVGPFVLSPDKQALRCPHPEQRLLPQDHFLRSADHLTTHNLVTSAHNGDRIHVKNKRDRDLVERTRHRACPDKNLTVCLIFS